MSEMYFVLVSNEFSEYSYSNTEYVLASKDKSILEDVARDIEILDSSVCCSIEEVESENFSYISESFSDHNYSYSLDEGIGLAHKKLDYLLKKKAKANPDNSIQKKDVNLTSLLSHEERIAILQKFTSDDPEVYLEGYARKRAAKESGEYYMDRDSYDTYKGVDISMKCDSYKY